MMSDSAKDKAFEIEDASQLSMLAYERAAYGRIDDADGALRRLRSEDARRIAEAIVDPAAHTDDRILRAAKYFIEWAENTAQRSVELSQRRRDIDS